MFDNQANNLAIGQAFFYIAVICCRTALVSIPFLFYLTLIGNFPLESLPQEKMVNILADFL